MLYINLSFVLIYRFVDLFSFLQDDLDGLDASLYKSVAMRVIGIACYVRDSLLVGEVFKLRR